MAPAKRRASSVSVESEAKRKCQGLAKAIKNADGLSASCKAMLAGMSTYALDTYQDERHPWQVSVVEMVKSAVHQMEDAMKARNAGRLTEVAKASDTKAARQAAVASAEAALHSAKETVAGKQAAVDEKLAALKEAKAALGDATRKQSSGDAAVKAVVEKRDAIEACKSAAFLPLKDGTLTTPQDVKKAMATVASISKKFDLEKPMVQAALEALKQKPTDRSAFLETSVGQMEERLTQLIAGLNDEISQADPAKQERASAVAAAETAKAEANARAESAKSDATMAQQAQQNAAANLKEARKAWTHFYADMKKVMDDSDNGPRELEEFRNTVMADLADMEALAPPPAAAEEEPTEEAAAEDLSVGADAAQPDA